MHPEPAMAEPTTAPPALSGPWEMTPLFFPPSGTDPSALQIRPIGHRAGPTRRTTRRSNTRPSGGQGNRSRANGKTASDKEQMDLLDVSPDRLRHALARSFLRYSIPGDLDAAVHAAMNVIEPVLEARDRELLRLRMLITAKLPGR
jgi:hypothetical protein